MEVILIDIKNNPQHLLETLNSVGIKKFHCCFIGDSLNDALCAKMQIQNLFY